MTDKSSGTSFFPRNGLLITELGKPRTIWGYLKQQNLKNKKNKRNERKAKTFKTMRNDICSIQPQKVVSIQTSVTREMGKKNTLPINDYAY